MYLCTSPLYLVEGALLVLWQHQQLQEHCLPLKKKNPVNQNLSNQTHLMLKLVLGQHYNENIIKRIFLYKTLKTSPKSIFWLFCYIRDALHGGKGKSSIFHIDKNTSTYMLVRL